MKVVEIDTILYSIENIKESGMGKKVALEKVKELIINNSFDLEIEPDEQEEKE